jgi:NAD-dependent SIR2 family protein deacetylase
MAFNLYEGDQIPYPDLVTLVYSNDGKQQMVPFVGAGVSVSDRTDKDKEVIPKYPDAVTFDEVATKLGFDGVARVYLEYATRVAARMQAWVKTNGVLPTLDALTKRLKVAEYPPAAWELAELFSLLSFYHSFMDKALPAVELRDLVSKALRDAEKAELLPMLKIAAMTTDLASASDPLTSISGYYESKSKRELLWQRLYDVIASKKTPTTAHRLVARAAAAQLAPDLAEDYLIITTNYDTLQELALIEANLPYVVLWRTKTGMVHGRIGNVSKAEAATFHERNPPRAPESLVIFKNRPMAIVYKMHGCLDPERTFAEDGLVITDNDYVGFIKQGTGMPSHVGQLLGNKRLLFLGYSFSDWNVRSVYEKAAERTAQTTKQDYAVTRSLSTFERTYFESRNIAIVKSDLRAFADNMLKAAP